MTAKERSRVINATVQIGGGQGVLVPGHFILTAAHCIKWNGEGGMAMGDYYIEDIATKSGHLRVGPAAVDPVSDIAVLRALDDQEFAKDASAFEAWCEATAPVPVLTKPLGYGQSRAAHILTYRGDWIGATVTNYGRSNPPRSGIAFIAADRAIEGGTSGGPVLDSTGRLIGVISNSADGAGHGTLPIASLALPRWVLLSFRS